MRMDADDWKGLTGMALILSLFIVVALVAGCAGQVPKPDDIAPGAEVTANVDTIFGDTTTTVKRAPNPGPDTAEQVENRLNKCLARHPDKEVRFCGCMEREKLENQHEYEAYCISDRDDPVPDEPPAAPPPDAPPPLVPPPPPPPNTPGAGERRKDQFMGLAERLVPQAFANASDGCRNAMADALVVLEGNPAFDDQNTANLLAWVAKGILPPPAIGLEDVYAQIHVEGCRP